MQTTTDDKRALFPLPAALASAFLVAAFYVALPAGVAEAAPCDADFYQRLRAPLTDKNNTIRVACDMELAPSDVIARKLDFAGEEASGRTLDCHGATIGTKASKPSTGSPTIAIRSVRQGKGKDGRWSVPHGITIRNCKIVGSLRLTGLGPNGEARAVRLSSLKRDHTQNAQAVAPTGIRLSGLTFQATGGIPLYFGPGVTDTAVEGSRFQGFSSKTAVYLDAESAANTLRGNHFAIKTEYRETIAVDGSAKNVISGNVFENPMNGGIYVYRNCGEGGTIRHQKPQYNEISGNRFVYRDALARPAIWLNHRDVGKLFCTKDPKYPFGSSLDPRDFASFNIVRNNRFSGPWSLRIVNFDDTNKITGNR